MGFLMQTTMLIAQNSVEQKDIGVASSAATFFRSIGGSFGVSLFGTIFIRTLTSVDLRASVRPAAAKLTGGGGQVDPSAARPAAKLPLPVLSGIADGDLERVLLGHRSLAVVVPVLALFIKHDHAAQRRGTGRRRRRRRPRTSRRPTRPPSAAPRRSNDRPHRAPPAATRDVGDRAASRRRATPGASSGRA